MTTFQITNTVVDPEDNTKIIVFIRYSNDYEESQRFSVETPVSDILTYIQGKAQWFDQQEIDRQNQAQDLIDNLTQI